MGGVNHQPCGKDLPYSIHLSKVVSIAHTRLMEANILLEKVLLGEVEKVNPEVTFEFWQRANSAFGLVACAMREVVSAIGASIDHMERTTYAHAAILEMLDIARLQGTLGHAGAINADDPAFTEVGTILKDGGFERMFRIFKERYQAHAKEADELAKVFEMGERYAREGGLLVAIEQNEFPFRLQFARVFNPLTRTMQLFSYSSLISIEVHYRSTHCRPGTTLLQHASHATV
ncbi:hypothetical protein EDM68_00995 [Candidatus Uhrbacteria bacterium]|nr:MAG: hypothetical protein EDM68_00995 [Candidatus Uhrbacteria bacterium]